MIFRSSGTVTDAGAREGVSKSSGKPYSIPFVVITLNDFVHTTVNVVDALVDKIHTGDVVDLICEVEAAGGYLRSQAVGFWPASEPAKTASPRPLSSTG